jgi:hypothetical protein
MTAAPLSLHARHTWLVPVLLCLGMLFALPTTAWARGGKRAGGGQVALTATALPGAKGSAGFLRTLKKKSRGRAVFHEDRASGSWKVHYAARISRPVRDVTIRIFDITRGRKFVAARDKMLFSASDLVTGSLSLTRAEVFQPNSRMLLVIEAPGGAVLAQRAFFIQGKAGPQAPRRRVVSMDFANDDPAAANPSPMPSIESVRPRHRRGR